MPKLSEELRNKIIAKYATTPSGQKLAGLEKQGLSQQIMMSVMHDPEHSFYRTTITKLQNFADGITPPKIAKQHNLKRKKSVKDNHIQKPEKSDTGKNIKPTVQNNSSIQSILINQQLQADLIHTLTMAVSLLKENVENQVSSYEASVASTGESVIKHNESVDKKLKEMKDNLDVMDRRLKYRNSDNKDLKDRLKQLEIKVEPAKFH